MSEEVVELAKGPGTKSEGWCPSTTPVVEGTVVVVAGADTPRSVASSVSGSGVHTLILPWDPSRDLRRGIGDTATGCSVRALLLLDSRAHRHAVHTENNKGREAEQKGQRHGQVGK